MSGRALRDAVSRLPELRRQATGTGSADLRPAGAWKPVATNRAGEMDTTFTGENGLPVRVTGEAFGTTDYMTVEEDGVLVGTTANGWAVANGVAELQAMASTHTNAVAGVSGEFYFGYAAIAAGGGESTEDLSFLAVRDLSRECIGALTLYGGSALDFFLWIAKLRTRPWLLLQASQKISMIVGASLIVSVACEGPG